MLGTVDGISWLKIDSTSISDQIAITAPETEIVDGDLNCTTWQAAKVPDKRTDILANPTTAF